MISFEGHQYQLRYHNAKYPLQQHVSSSSSLTYGTKLPRFRLDSGLRCSKSFLCEAIDHLGKHSCWSYIGSRKTILDRKRAHLARQTRSMNHPITEYIHQVLTPWYSLSLALTIPLRADYQHEPSHENVPGVLDGPRWISTHLRLKDSHRDVKIFLGQAESTAFGFRHLSLTLTLDTADRDDD